MTCVPPLGPPPTALGVTAADVVELTVLAVVLGLGAVMVKFAELDPCGTITLMGTVTIDVLELETVTIAPPVPAGEVRVIVPVADWPGVIALRSEERRVGEE